MKIKYLLFVSLFFLGATINAQTNNVGIGTINPDGSALLDLSSTDKGLLVPRIFLKSTKDVVTISNPAQSLFVYNASNIADIKPGFYYWDVDKWVPLSSGATLGDIVTTLTNDGKGVYVFVNEENVKSQIDVVGDIVNNAGDIFLNTDKPYTSLNQENTNNNRIFYVDSIANNKPYSYRIQGISSFGELGPYSEIITGKGKSLLKFVPHLTVKDFKDDTTVTLSWEFPEEGNEEISGFELNRSDKDDEKYTTVLKNIPAKNRSVTYNKLLSTNYFTITAIGKQGNSRTSFPMLVQPVDSIPPSKPIGLKGVIDSLGIVKITWAPNKEKDLMGYRIYRGNTAEEEFSQLTVSPSEPNTYEDKVIIKSLNSKVYYRVIAVDYHYNMSPFSETLIIKKPDVIPPTSPVFTKYEIKDGAVFLEWVNSQSEDVASHQLYRKENEQEKWELILNDVTKLESFQDKKTNEGSTYRYAIFAKDESGLVSNPTPEIALFIPKYTVKPAVKGFYAQANTATKSIDLSWDYKESDVDSFEIYKATNQEPLQLIQILKGESRKLSDPTLTINTTYKYGIRAQFKDGRMSKMVFYTVKF
ncbi:hypothetical protein [Flavobacterium sp. KMS]|uniref:fibronectin type III domain-containing protein n=1 Tax=Flavobacterium sp. KMS TaxID=1566023 RepID=UPI00069053D5|nr:hypothetical protein [Flavobacterium sp. KMS]